MGKRICIEIQTGTIFAAAAALLILPLSFFASFLMAALVHELCHYLILWLAGVNVYRVSIGPFGAVMETEAMAPGRELLCALAGPAGSFFLVVCHEYIPGIALCALIQGCFNLLPIYPMDGGRVIKCILELLKIPKRDIIFIITQLFTGVVVAFICLYGFWKWNLGLGVLVLGGAVLLRAIPRKTPCKDGLFGVQ